jgi:hypothetical protein
MAANGISTLATKELRQKAKLDLASLKRQGYTLNADGTIESTVSAHLTTTGAQNYAANGPTMNTFRVLNRGGNWDEFFANWDNGTWSCVQFPGSVVTNMTDPGDDSPIITITGGTFLLDATYSFTGDVLTAGTADTGAPFYRTRATYDLTLLPTQYNDNAIVNNPNTGALTVGRPWISTVSAFTFYEAFGTTTAISTTQYVSGNKIYAESSTYDVPSFQPARVVVNDISVVNTELRGHTLVVLDSYGDVVTGPTQYDTWDTGGAPGARAALATALGAVASGRIAVLVTYDATGLDAGIRSAINTGYGSTNTNTWVSGRQSHIFIGIKV